MPPCRILPILALACVAAMPASASASETAGQLPQAAAEMIAAALASGDKMEAEAVVRTAKRTWPAAMEEIDRQVAAWTIANTSSSAVRPHFPPSPPARTMASRKSPAGVSPETLAKWSGEGEAGAFVNTGNAPGIGLVGGFKMLVEGESWRIGTSARADYQETAGVVTREQYRFSAEPNYKFDSRGYLFGLGQFEQDRFQGFASRYSVSGGFGYKVLKGDSAKLSVKAGPAWRVTQPLAEERESVVAGLASLEAKVNITPTLQFSQDANAYVDATGSTFYTLAALDSKLIGKLKARISYMVQHETAPEPGRINTDTTSRLTLVYGF